MATKQNAAPEHATNTENRPRKPWVAVLMGFVLPGFGQLYNGELNKAIWYFIAFVLVSVPGVALVALHIPKGAMIYALIIGVLLALGIWGYGMVDAREAAQRKQDYRPRRWQVSGVYALVFILCNVLALPLLISYVRTYQVASFYIPSASMAPSVLEGDILFADKRYNCPGCKQAIARGDIAIFTYPNNRTQIYIKRIIGLPGDHIRIRDKEVFVNDKSLTQQESFDPASALGAKDLKGLTVNEGYGDNHWQVVWTDATLRPASGESNITVPAGEVFVMGDNRNATKDSRAFGSVPMHDVVGKATQLWFSKGDEGVRVDRIGKVLH